MIEKWWGKGDCFMFRVSSHVNESDESDESDGPATNYALQPDLSHFFFSVLKTTTTKTTLTVILSRD